MKSKSIMTLLALFLVAIGLFNACESEDIFESREKDILTFSFPQETEAAKINNLSHTIEVEVTNGTDLTKLTPTFTVSAKATADPASGTESDYSSKFTIVVTAEDGSNQDWEVDVTEAEGAGGGNGK